MSEEEKKFINEASRNGLIIPIIHLTLLIVPFAINFAIGGISFYYDLVYSGQFVLTLIQTLMSVLLCVMTIYLFFFAGSRKSFAKAFPLVLSGLIGNYLISIKEIVSFISTVLTWNQFFSSGHYNGRGLIEDLESPLVTFIIFFSVIIINTVFLVFFLKGKCNLCLPKISDASSEREQKNREKLETYFKKIRIVGLIILLTHLGFLCVIFSLNLVEAAHSDFRVPLSIYDVFQIILPRLPDISICLLCLILTFMGKSPMRTSNRKTLLLGGFSAYLLLFFWEQKFIFFPSSSYFWYDTANSYFSLPSIVFIVVYAAFFSRFLYNTKTPKIKEEVSNKALLAGVANEQLQIAIDAHDFKKAGKIQKQIEDLSTVTPSATRSYFDGHLIQLLGWTCLCFIVDAITLGICVPFTICWKLQWECKHTVLNGKRLSFDGNGLQLLGKWILWLFLSLITIGIYSFFLVIKLKQWKVSHTHLADLA